VGDITDAAGKMMKRILGCYWVIWSHLDVKCVLVLRFSHVLHASLCVPQTFSGCSL
jgi:hypothetical protein